MAEPIEDDPLSEDYRYNLVNEAVAPILAKRVIYALCISVSSTLRADIRLALLAEAESWCSQSTGDAGESLELQTLFNPDTACRLGTKLCDFVTELGVKRRVPVYVIANELSEAMFRKQGYTDTLRVTVQDRRPGQEAAVQLIALTFTPHDSR